MARQPALTLILLTPHRLYRADFTRPGASPELSDIERPSDPDVPAAVEAALYSGAQPGKIVYVLATDFWIQTLGMLGNRVYGLPADELAQALNFEAEAFSGLPAAESTVAAISLSGAAGEKRFLLIQVKTADRHAIARMLHRRGSRLGGLLHPAALPRPIGGGDLQPRLELWADAAIALRPIEGEIDVQVSNADPQTGRWQTDLADWSFGRLVVGPQVRVPAATDFVPLDKLDILTSWFSSWAAELSGRQPRAAIVRALPAPTPTLTKVLLGTAAVALVAAGLYVHWTNYSRDLADLRGRTAAANEKSKRVADLEAKIKTALQERDMAVDEAAHFDQLTRDLKNLQGRYASLLAVLATQKPSEAMIRRIEIESETGEPKLVGVALRPEIIDEYAHALTMTARPLGWEVRSPHETAQNLAADGGPWVFEISLSPAIAVSQSTSNAPKVGRRK